MPKTKSTKKDIPYCTLEPDFPQDAYILFLFIMHEGKSVGIVPLDTIYRTPDDAAKGVRNVIKQLKKTRHITIPEESIILPISLSSRFPMKKEFWVKPTLSYDQHARVRAFSPVAHHPSLYSLLVTPYAYNDKTKNWLFSATLPFLQSKSLKIVEQFMYTSNQVVEPRAKHSAIYTIQNKKRFNWKTKELKDIEQSVDEMLGKVN